MLCSREIRRLMRFHNSVMLSGTNLEASSPTREGLVDQSAQFVEKHHSAGAASLGRFCLEQQLDPRLRAL